MVLMRVLAGCVMAVGIGLVSGQTDEPPVELQQAEQATVEAGLAVLDPAGEQLVKEEQKLQEARKERIRTNKAELKRLRLVDSVGWLKITALRRPDKSMDDLERERQLRKIAELIGFCDETKFTYLSEVDSLSGMTADEKTFCKQRLKIVNPTIQ
jgi:hypothetical protein